MKITHDGYGRGFPTLVHPVYVAKGNDDDKLVMQSSAIGDYDDAFDKPGSSYLWFGQNHHLNREEVAEVVKYLKRWLKTGSLE